ncbi:hypothetical protein N7509_008000 [Penicillium cosmopolitanum]|uniref:Uncharacterized protein n=1 Tax=Penicillium cosmopolitanum TaxID=1131564 RepID=A0A9X0B8X0_9EURO|nr:uncharacterized protein N7509_008000 [Penicillium cosmopolitanum]KAJ5392510.1 hypothetical protein N7509_008000 [Penicillium cosmopolitanum]
MRDVLSYSQAVRIGDRIAGGWNPETSDVHVDLAKEVHQVFSNVELALKYASGNEWSHNLQKWMPDHKPVLTCVEVKGQALEGMRIEIEAFAHDI